MTEPEKSLSAEVVEATPESMLELYIQTAKDRGIERRDLLHAPDGSQSCDELWFELKYNSRPNKNGVSLTFEMAYEWQIKQHLQDDSEDEKANRQGLARGLIFENPASFIEWNAKYWSISLMRGDHVLLEYDSGRSNVELHSTEGLKGDIYYEIQAIDQSVPEDVFEKFFEVYQQADMKELKD